LRQGAIDKGGATFEDEKTRLKNRQQDSRDILGDLSAFFGCEFLDSLRVRLRLGVDGCAIQEPIVRLNHRVIAA